MFNDNNEVPRSVQRSDLLVVFIAFIHNLISSFHALTEELLDLAVYNANRKNKINKVWKDFSQDLEKIQEDNNG